MSFQKLVCCWADLLYGRACCLWNCIFAPCVLGVWSFSIYCCGCLRIYASRNGSSSLFKDQTFPASAKSLGDHDEEVVWLRATKYARTKSLQLVHDGLDVCAVCRGASGEAWLLSAVASVAARGSLHHLFESLERTARGKYILRLFDGAHQRWQRITLDDRVPCEREAYDEEKRFKPIFLNSKDNDLFLLLIEKAFAKVLGGYHRLKEGSTAWALSAMTGDQTRIFVRAEDGSWARKELEEELDDAGERSLSLFGTGVELSPEVLFEVLRKYCLLESVLCAAGASASSGLHPKQTYGILDVRKVPAGLKLGDWLKVVQMRHLAEATPWRSRDPEVREAMGVDDETSFRMSWEEFLATWRTIAVVDLPSGIESLRFQVTGGSPLAPAVACLGGCTRFWCGLGCRHLYCPYRVVQMGDASICSEERTVLGFGLEKE